MGGVEDAANRAGFHGRRDCAGWKCNSSARLTDRLKREYRPRHDDDIKYGWPNGTTFMDINSTLGVISCSGGELYES